MHQHVEHDIFRHPAGEIADRNANQRHLRQARIGHQRVDAGAQVENHAKVSKRRKLALLRLPDGGVMNVGGIERRVGQQHYAPIPAHLVESLLPSFRRPVFGPAMNEQSERAFIHRIFAS
jgi:hypothetical protein